jgi:hypothetical protein
MPDLHLASILERWVATTSGTDPEQAAAVQTRLYAELAEIEV